MNTPIYDFVKAYRDLRPARFHMPGHKGRGPLGCEDLDLTEIPGADSLYEAAGIIAESEVNASNLFGCPTFYSTEGSSHCIRAMLLLASQLCHSERSEESVSTAAQRAASLPEAATENGGYGFLTAFGMTRSKRLRVLAARNVHSAFLTAAALLDLDVCWLPAGGAGSYLSAHPTPEALDATLAETGAGAVYLTCPDYLGELPDLGPLAAVCHAHGALLLVDNAHGAYLRFLSPSRHPMDLGADLCCDSAHKTLPVLTGGAYLHVSGRLLEATGNGQQATDPPVEGTLSHRVSDPLCPQAEEGRTSNACPYEPGRETRPLRCEAVRDALALFGSTSPSYLILQSLDLANPWLKTLPERLAVFLPKVEALKARLTAVGWTLTGNEPLKLTISLPHCHSERSEESVLLADPTQKKTDPSTPLRSAQDDGGEGGLALAAALEQEGVFCEFADPEHVVFMLTPENTDEELERLETALSKRTAWGGRPMTAPTDEGANTGDGSLCSLTGDSNEATAAQHREPSPVSNRPKATTDATSSVTASPCHLPLKGKALREAMLSPAVRVPAGESLGRVLARPGVNCPPAVPILMPGERIDEAAVEAFEKYGIGEISVLP